MGRKNSNTLGHIAEEYASKLLSRNGYKILERNFHGRLGEIDIIALKDKKLIFVEVKARTSLKFGTPVEAVTYLKLYKIGRTGEYYSILHPELPKSLKIEVVSLLINQGKVVEGKIISVD